MNQHQLGEIRSVQDERVNSDCVLFIITKDSEGAEISRKRYTQLPETSQKKINVMFRYFEQFLWPLCLL